MQIKEFKRVGRILKAAYKKVEAQARESGMDLMSPEYEALIDRVRMTVLKEMGFTLDEYRKAKAKAGGKEIEEDTPKPQANRALKAVYAELDKHAKKMGIKKGSPEYEVMKRKMEGVVMKEMDVEIVEKRTTIPFEREMTEIAESVARQIIPPPQVLKEIYEYDDSELQYQLQELSDKLGKVQLEPDLKALAEKLKDEILTWNADNFAENFQKNINILGMPDFRKLAMGLQAQIDELSASGSGDVTGPASSTDNNLASFDGATGKIIQDSGKAAPTGDIVGTTDIQTLTNKTLTSPKINEDVAVTATATELNYVDGVTSAIQTQLDAKQASDAGLTDIAGLAVTDGNIIVGNGTNWVAESGATARTSLGLGTAAVVNTDLADLNEATIEGAIDTLANLTSIQGHTVTLTGAFIRSGAHSLTLTTSGATDVTLPTTGTLATLAGTETLTNKDVSGATNTLIKKSTDASDATPTPTGDSHINHYSLTALAEAAEFAAPSGTPAEGNRLTIRIHDNGTARALTWNAIYTATSEVALPTTTILGKELFLGFLYDATDSKWRLVAAANEA